MNGGYFIVPEELYTSFPEGIGVSHAERKIPGISAIINDAFKSGKPMYLSAGLIRGSLSISTEETADAYALYGFIVVFNSGAWVRIEIVFSVHKANDTVLREIFVTPID